MRLRPDKVEQRQGRANSLIFLTRTRRFTFTVLTVRKTGTGDVPGACTRFTHYSSGLEEENYLCRIVITAFISFPDLKKVIFTFWPGE